MCPWSFLVSSRTHIYYFLNFLNSWFFGRFLSSIGVTQLRDYCDVSCWYHVNTKSHKFSPQCAAGDNKRCEYHDESKRPANVKTCKLCKNLFVSYTVVMTICLWLVMGATAATKKWNQLRYIERPAQLYHEQARQRWAQCYGLNFAILWKHAIFRHPPNKKHPQPIEMRFCIFCNVGTIIRCAKSC